MATHYELLGVAPHATHEEIRRAYRQLAQRHHPDANPGTGSDMAEINAAWEVLGDPERRRDYDRAIGTTPRPQFRVHVTDEPEDPLEHLRDEPGPPPKSRPSDILIAIPVGLFVLVLAMFVLSAMSQSTGLRTASILMAPVTAGSFVAAPLFMMLRSRNRDR